MGVSVQPDDGTSRPLKTIERASVERRRALEILREVRAGARADVSLERHATGLDPRERAFVMELAYGAIRWRGRLDYHLRGFLEDFKRLPPDVLSILELGAYQLLFMDRVPEWAAVDESVRLARGLPRASGRSAGLVNGVLRNLVRGRGKLPLPDPADLAGHLAVKHSHPRWIVERWLERYGAETTEALLVHNNTPPGLHLAVNPRATTSGAVLEAITAAGYEARAHPLKPDAIVVGPGARPEDLPGWVEGHFWVQDAAAQWVAEIPEAPRGRFLDGCAAPGGKLCGLLARSAGARGLAVDRDAGRLGRIRANCDRLGMGGQWLVAADARALPTTERFPLVVADVPCSGTGVLRRRVDARWRRRSGDPAAFGAFQRELLVSLGESVQPGGTLVYATCSLEPEENEDVVTAFLGSRRNFRCAPVDDRIPAPLRAGPYLATRPWTGDHDGMFAARLVREAA
ncbi:MAG TPA: transcription antitermination factor NusB [Gemmatimonadota bacterium]|nr:transcription antitermination factor NusB [Gemmatimonadota bacterium]